MQMPNGLLYVCKKCGKWSVTNPALTLEGCPHCKGELHHVAINMNQYNGWSEDIQRAFQYNYLIGKYTDGVPPVPEIKPTAPTAKPRQQASQQPARQTAPKQQKAAKGGKAAGCLGVAASLAIRALIGLVIFFLFTGGANFLSKFNGLQRDADMSLNTMVRLRSMPATGSYVSLDTRWVLGPFATETNTYSYGSRHSSGSGIKATVSETKFFYVILDDGTVMAIKTSNAGEIETLERMSTWLARVDGYPDNGEMITLKGSLESMPSDVRRYYDEHLSSVGLASGTPNIRYLILDTTAGREMIYIIIGGAVAVLVIVLIVRSVIKKKKKAAQA